MRHFVLWCFCLSLAMQGFCSLHAEETPAPAIHGVEKFNISTEGTGLYRPEKWGLVKLSLRNPQNQEVTLLAATHFADDPTLQFGRRLWMPAHSRMTTWHPLRMPATSNPDQKFFDLQTLVMSTEGGQETLAMNEVGAMQFDQSLRVSPDSPVTAVITEPMLEPTTRSLWANSLDLLLTARYERNLTKNYVNLGTAMIPKGEELLDALDHLIIADDRFLTDSAGIGAIRRWVAGGGSLWVMADEVSPALLEALLGDEHSITVVDRVGLTHVKIVTAPGAAVTAPFERDLDRPAPLVRIVAEDIDPDFLVDGWPASFWKSYGEGRILVTTLGANGWVRPRRTEDPLPSSGDSFKTGFVPGEPLSKLAAEFFVPHPAPAMPVAVAEEQVRQMIGYTIPGRGMVLGTLLGFTLLFGASAVWLGRTGRLEWLGVATPLAAVVAAGLLLTTGMSARSQVSDTTAVVQLVEAVPGTEDIRTVGVAGLFSKSDEAKASLSGTAGGWIMPEMSGIEGSNRRLIWTDIDRWSWENLPQKPGLRTARTQASGRADTPLAAVASFSSESLSGQVSLPKGLEPTDAILATSSGRLGLTIDSQGHWQAGRDAELGADQYLTASVLSDEQQRRSLILAEILKSTPTRTMPRVPTLYFWTKPWKAGLSFGADDSIAGSALVSVPLHWQPVPGGTEFTIPRPLLTFREVIGPDGARPSGYYDIRAKQWVERTGATSGWVAFDLPRALLPLVTKRVDITFKVVGSMGRLEVLGFQNGSVRSLQSWDNPVGTLTCTIEDGSLVPIDDSGRLTFRVDAGIANVDPDPSLEGSIQQSEEESRRERRRLNESEPEHSPDSDQPKNNPLTYWQFEDISARITVVAPSIESASLSTP